jgi:transcriptional regulator with XRE-family HTH domain
VTPTKSPATDTFGEYLRQLMRAAGYEKAADLVKVAGISHGNLSRWLEGSSVPSIEALRRISPHLGVGLVPLMIRAGLVTKEELGVTGSPAPAGPPLPPIVRDIILRLTGPGLTERQKRALVNHLEYSVELFYEVLDQVANSPREPRMRSRDGR